jgi:hypothetical protein
LKSETLTLSLCPTFRVVAFRARTRSTPVLPFESIAVAAAPGTKGAITVAVEVVVDVTVW